MQALPCPPNFALRYCHATLQPALSLPVRRHAPAHSRQGLLLHGRTTTPSGHKRYQPVWEMVNKLRDVMGKRDDEYMLEGAIEPDDAFFSTEIFLEERDKPLKRGRGQPEKDQSIGNG